MLEIVFVFIWDEVHVQLLPLVTLPSLPCLLLVLLPASSLPPPSFGLLSY